MPLILNKTDESIMQYSVDYKLLKKVEQLSLKGYNNCSLNIIDHMDQVKKFTDRAEAEEYLKKYILVKYDKPHSCYNYFELLDNL